MRHREITESADPFLYHATRRENLPAITREGLTPNSDRDSNFGDYPVDGRLFVSKTFDGAEWYAGQLRELFDLQEPEDAVILRFTKRGIKTKRDPYGDVSDGYTLQGVPPSMIEVLTDGNWHRLTPPRRLVVEEGRAKPAPKVTLARVNQALQSAGINARLNKNWIHYEFVVPNGTDNPESWPVLMVEPYRGDTERVKHINQFTLEQWTDKFRKMKAERDAKAEREAATASRTYRQRERTKKVHEARHPLIAEHTQPFDDDDSTYKSGYCYAFAFAVNKLTGWPMYALRRKYDRSSETLHVFNEMPDRQHVFDCHGITSWASMEQNYDAMDPKVWSERWDESDIRLAIRRRDLMKMPRALVRNAMADAAAVLRDENIEVPISVPSIVSRQRPPNDALFYTPKRRFAPTHPKSSA